MNDQTLASDLPQGEPLSPERRAELEAELAGLETQVDAAQRIVDNRTQLNHEVQAEVRAAREALEAVQRRAANVEGDMVSANDQLVRLQGKRDAIDHELNKAVEV